MPRLKIAVQLASLKQPFRRALQTAARLGASAVELDARSEARPEQLSETGLRDLRRRLDEFDLGISAISFRTRRGYDTLEDLDRRVDATKQALTMAARLRVPVVVNQVGRVPADADSTAMRTMVAALTDLGHFGLRVGSLLAAQTGTESGAELASLLARLPERSVVVDLDPGNLIINEHSPAKAIAALGPLIASVHARDGVRDLSRRRGIETPLGAGSADFPAILAALENYGYSGYLTVAREQADDPIGEVAQAIEYLRNLE